MLTKLPELLAGYRAVPDSFDELMDASHVPRAHWRTLLDSFANEPPEMMHQRHDMVQRQVRENGVSYNVYTDVKGMQRPWDLNLLPLIIPEHEWAEIESGVIQRATLLNSLLCDVYGDQNMVREGLLPPSLIHGHAGFLRPCHGKYHIDGAALHFYAIDLARAPNGRWWVVGDRTQAPSGAGYALENRSVLARTFPDLLRELRVQHLSGFFNTMRASLVHWGRQCAINGGAPLRNSEPPLIVLLTPGPYNETYYEQAYLARYLGFPLVEGSDLTVRNNIVWLKSLSGLQRVHVILRRVDDDFCDPLELRTDSALGVAGLTQAAKAGNVLVANSLGSSLLESGALLGFLPGLCERLLGESLKMPSVATWWCGEPAALETVIEKLDDLIIKPSFPQLREYPVFGQDLKGEERAAFIKKIRANPANYVAQELVKLSKAPVWKPAKNNIATSQGHLSARAIGLRVFACATPNGYVVMPGGLTRVATGSDDRIITMQRGGSSKDTWVQTSGKVKSHNTLTRTTTSKDLIRDDTHLSSRVAENMFWFGRNAERCDNTARLLRVAINFQSNVIPANRGAEWPTIMALCAWFRLVDVKAKVTRNAQAAAKLKTHFQTGEQGPGQPNPSQSQNQSQNMDLADDKMLTQMQSFTPPPLPNPTEIFTDEEIESELLDAVTVSTVPGLASQLQQLHNVASQLSERFSIDNWRALSRLGLSINSASQQLSQAEALELLDDTAAALMTMTGFALDGMNRDLGWRFLSLGRRLERLQFQSIALQRGLRMGGNGNLDWLLELGDSIITYRSRYRAQPEWLPVLDLLLLDESNPRSIRFQVAGILKSLRKIGRSYGPCGKETLEALSAELLALDPDTDLYCNNNSLLNLLSRIQSASEALSEQISLQFFSYTSSPKSSIQSNNQGNQQGNNPDSHLPLYSHNNLPNSQAIQNNHTPFTTSSQQ